MRLGIGDGASSRAWTGRGGSGEGGAQTGRKLAPAGVRIHKVSRGAPTACRTVSATAATVASPPIPAFSSLATAPTSASPSRSAAIAWPAPWQRRARHTEDAPLVPDPP